MSIPITCKKCRREEYKKQTIIVNLCKQCIKIEYMSKNVESRNTLHSVELEREEREVYSLKETLLAITTAYESKYGKTSIRNLKTEIQ